MAAKGLRVWLAVALVAGLALGWLWGRLSSAEPEAPALAREVHPDAASERAYLDELRGILEDEIRARMELARKVDHLEQRVAESSGALASTREIRDGLVEAESVSVSRTDAAESDQGAAEPDALISTADGGDMPAGEGPGAIADANEPPVKPRFNAQSLLQAGSSDEDVALLRSRWERFELDKLALNHEAVRAGSVFSAGHLLAHQKLNAELRAEVGARSYSQLLYATGRPNQVIVRDVLDPSLRSSSGLLPGDVIVRYDGHGVYSGGDIRAFASIGTEGESVRVEVLRGGKAHQVYVPRGPLPVALGARRVKP